MVNLRSLDKKCPEGIPFSECRKLMMKGKSKKTKRKTSRSPSRKRQRRKQRLSRQKSRRRSSKKVPPQGVIIRKGSILLKSDGKKMIPIN